MAFLSYLSKVYDYRTTVLSFCCVFITLIAFLISSPSQAVEVEGLYSASVPVTSRDDEDERQRAFSLAMREVLLKVSGSNEVLNLNAIRAAMRSPGDYVETWGYRSVQISEEGEDANAAELMISTDTELSPPLDSDFLELIELEISFFESEILNLLDDNNFPFWPANRPATLLWLVVQDELGEREMLGANNAAADEMLALIRSEMQGRALPLLLPVMDLEDRRAINADDLWNLDEEKVTAASQRYQTESILALRIYRSLSGELIGKSLYLFRDRLLSLESFEEEQGEFVGNAVALAAEELSSYYAIRISAGASNVLVDLTVNGIDSANTYAELLGYVGALTDVNSFQVVSIEQQSLVLRLSTGGQLRQLVETIALDETMELITDLNRDADGVHMFYRWID